MGSVTDHKYPKNETTSDFVTESLDWLFYMRTNPEALLICTRETYTPTNILVWKCGKAALTRMVTINVSHCYF